jgi:malate dehydrogenase (oxaloacetate-decarboxylating)(NADP+)
MRMLMNRAKSNPKTIIMAEADHLDVLKAAQIIHDDGIGTPILLGDKKIIKELMKEINFTAKLQILDPKCDEEEERRNKYAQVYWEKRQRNGITLFAAQKLMRERNYFAAMMLNEGDGETLVTGYSRSYPSVVKPMIELIGREEGVKRIAATNIMLTKRGPIFFSDTAINIEPTAEELANICYMTAKTMEMFGFEPNLAMLSFSNFGSSDSPLAEKVSQAVKIMHSRYPEINVDGEIQADFALNPKLLKEKFPFSKLNGKKVNGLIFPNLEAANIGYKLMKEFDQIVSIGPIIMGLQKPVHILQLGASVDEIVNMACVANVHAQEKMNSK